MTTKLTIDHLFKFEDHINALTGASSALILLDLSTHEERNGVEYLAGQIDTYVKNLDTVFGETMHVLRGNGDDLEGKTNTENLTAVEQAFRDYGKTIKHFNKAPGDDTEGVLHAATVKFTEAPITTANDARLKIQYLIGISWDFTMAEYDAPVFKQIEEYLGSLANQNTAMAVNQHPG